MDRREGAQLDKAVSYDLLKRCCLESAMDQGLARCFTLQPMVQQALTLQCVYVAKVLRSVKHLTAQGKTAAMQEGTLTSAKLARAYEIAQWPNASTSLPTEITIGIIGCGVVGGSILEALLKTKLFHATCFTVSTRQPEAAPPFLKGGINVCFDNECAAQSSDLLFLCCLPTQLQDVAAKIRGKVKPSCVVVSTLLGVTAERVVTVLGHPHCMVTSVDTKALSSNPAAAQVQTASSSPFLRHPVGQTEAFIDLLLKVSAPSQSTAALILAAVLYTILPKGANVEAMTYILNLPPHQRGKAKLTTWGGIAALDAAVSVPIVRSVAEQFTLLCDDVAAGMR
eukprot:TRINITY_DN3973_c0_g12_i1.p2 TRINITY_DN3973_c0_g12~~TRINITY_DN3973_c0_g12_i1.p2  ORF type:complete len:339 (+),score=87.94 TRINITY_DN3973_c0_g12_i1:38-1054(+)